MELAETLVWPGEFGLVIQFIHNPVLPIVPSMVLSEGDGWEQHKHWSVWKLEWLQIWAEGQAGRFFSLPFVLYRKSRPFVWVGEVFH